MTCERRDLEEVAIAIEQHLDPLTGENPPPTEMALAVLLAAAEVGLRLRFDDLSEADHE